ncbi:hypothetical protein [Mycobacterium sp. NAZ190054]|uniref:DUF6973 domain-containing protein n=1 Tax=Mycobacterium sp. NAZ190054 TaxID=1747766 RepID=UPI000799D1B5|nr:hypothetical protein [Mycobacterium sp. NAZ190054]KWX66385.1 hypothetical protein ASJ79_25795 [Mycobacterium sp. NAZ190054]
MSTRDGQRLAEILATYRAAEDPGGTQLFDVSEALSRAAGEIAFVELTQTEIAMMRADPARIPDLFVIRDHATAEAVARFPPPDGRDVDNHTDAFRHAYASALMTHRFGEEWTARFTAAHEGRPDNDTASMAMDLFNNEVGRGIAAANPDASPLDLADLVQQSVRAGELVVVGPDGRLAWSDDEPR